MKDFFKNKFIVITGAASGIGKDLAYLFTEWGANLALIDFNQKDLAEVVINCQNKTDKSILEFHCDVADIEKMQNVAQSVLEKWQNKIDIVIGNAGVGGLNPGYDFNLNVHKKVVDINVIGLANTLGPYIPSMMKQKSGILVGVSSLAGFRGLPMAASYSSTKAAQKVMMESLRLDLKRFGISSLSIHPGFIQTPISGGQDDFNTPFELDVRTSSLHIAKAIYKRKSLYLYPFPMRVLTFINRILPCWLYDIVLPMLNNNSEARAQVYSSFEGNKDISQH